MAITDGSAISFANETVRPLADRIAQVHSFAKDFLDYWDANAMGDVFTVGGGDVEDGAPNDGRQVITGNSVLGFHNWVAAFVSDLEASGNTNLNTVLNISVNPTP